MTWRPGSHSAWRHGQEESATSQSSFVVSCVNASLYFASQLSLRSEMLTKLTRLSQSR